MYLWHLIFSQYLFGRTISIFSVYIVDLFIYFGYFMLSLIYFVFPTSNNNIWNLELVKTLFLVLSMLGSFTLIMKEEENLYFTLPSSFFPSFHFFSPSIIKIYNLCRTELWKCNYILSGHQQSLHPWLSHSWRDFKHFLLWAGFILLSFLSSYFFFFKKGS